MAFQDRALIYHTAKERAVAGVAKVVSEVRFSRLSVMPVSPAIWQRLEKKGR